MSAAARKPRIVVAEDDRSTSHLLCESLRAWGVVALPAYDGMQAMMMAMRERPAAILLDLGMPGGTGMTTLQRLKLSAKTTEIPVIVVTGAPGDDVEAKCREAGADDFLRKPVDLDALRDVLTGYLPAQTEG